MRQNKKNSESGKVIRPTTAAYNNFGDDTPSNILHDGGVAYIASSSYLNTVAQNLAGKVQVLKDMLQNNNRQASHITAFEKIDMINKGISKKDLEFLKQKSGLGYDQLSEVLDVARATLINKKGNDKFNPTLSEKIVGLADIYSYGYEVFGDEVKFNARVFMQNQALGGKSPYSLLSNQYGREEIKNLIGRIDYGVYA
jgi:putative toxin-antitoxin system antitoxin component (TIGR02293 family)